MDSLAFQLTWDAQDVYASLVLARLVLIIIVALTEIPGQFDLKQSIWMTLRELINVPQKQCVKD